ncbi:SYVM protein, partial [Pluvianellus socialis]|nr:SYVM protein [Pluvianellus socialis]
MSKSLGNVIDPRDVIAGASLQRRQFPHGIPECGADGLRLALCSHNVHGDDIRLDVGTILGYRHFCNKVWNAVKFVLAALGSQFEAHHPPEETVPEQPMERWVLSRLVQAVGECGRHMEALEVHGAVAAVHHFWLRHFCDVYLVGGRPSV